MYKNIPVFITADGGFNFISGKTFKAVIDQVSTGQPKSIFFSNKKITMFIHKALEDVMGFHIPLLVSGAVLDKPVQPCVLWNADGSIVRYDAYIVFQEREDRTYGLIICAKDIVNAICDKVDQ